jgi:hypothetical protein
VGWEVAIRRLLAAALCAALVASSPDPASAEPPPPAPPAPPPVDARVVVAASACGGPRDCRWLPARVETQVHRATLAPDPAGVLTLDTGTPGQARWDAVDYDEPTGGRLVFSWPLGGIAAARGGWDVTLAGTWWGSWIDERTMSGTIASTATPGAPPNMSGTSVGMRSAADLGDASVLGWRRFGLAPCLDASLGAGLRFLQFDEQSSFLFPTTVPPANAAVFTADLSSTLLAAELAARVEWRFLPRLALGVRGSAFAGWMRRSGDLATSNVNPPPALAGLHDDTFGYGAEAEVALRWHVTSRWSLTLGYGVLWVGPVARAFEAYDFSNVATSDLGPVFTDDTLVVHRVFAGIALTL